MFYKLACKKIEMNLKIRKISKFKIFFTVSIIISQFQNFLTLTLIEESSQNSLVVRKKCPSHCYCVWKNGKSSVACENLQLTEIPFGIPNYTQVLNLLGNKIQSLEDKVFLNLHLNHLQKISLAKNKISQIGQNAFIHLSNLVDLNLGFNLINKVPSNALTNSPSLRRLYLNNNPIELIPNYAFSELKLLDILILTNCQIELIENQAFAGLTNLKKLHLNGNKLRQISGFVVESLSSLYELNLHENNWYCDCNIYDLRKWMSAQKIPFIYSPICHQPIRLKGKPWKIIEIDEFACKPKISSIKGELFYEGENASLVCKVESMPSSKIEWSFDSQFSKGYKLTNATYMSFGKQFILIHEFHNGPVKISTLYINNILEKDNGRFFCKATNKAGHSWISTQVTVIPTLKEKAQAYNGELVAGITLALIFIVLIIFFVFCLIVFHHKHMISQILNKNRKNTNQEKHYDQDMVKKDTIIETNLAIKDRSVTNVKIAQNLPNDIKEANSNESFGQWNGSKKCLSVTSPEKNFSAKENLNKFDDLDLVQKDQKPTVCNNKKTNHGLETNQNLDANKNNFLASKLSSQRINGISSHSLKLNLVNKTKSMAWNFPSSQQEQLKFNVGYNPDYNPKNNASKTDINNIETSTSSRILPVINKRRFTEPELVQMYYFNQRLN